MLKKLGLAALAATTLQLASFANAADLTVEGEVTSSTGSISALIGASGTINASAVLSNAVSANDAVSVNDVLYINVVAGGICLDPAGTTELTICPPAKVGLDLIANPGNSATYAHPESTGVNLVSGGTIVIKNILSGEVVPITLTFAAPTSDTTAGGIRTVTGTATFFADGNANGNVPLGTASGNLEYSLKSPIAGLVINGEVVSSSGSISALIGASGTITAKAILPASVNDNDAVGVNDVLDINVVAGGVCLDPEATTVAGTCPSGTVGLDLVANPGNSATYAHPESTGVDLVSGGTIVIKNILSGEVVPITLTFGTPSSDQVINGYRVVKGAATFFADGNANGNVPLGDASGSLNYALYTAVDGNTGGEEASVPMLPIFFNVVLFASLVMGWRKYKTSVK